MLCMSTVYALESCLSFFDHSLALYQNFCAWQMMEDECDPVVSERTVLLSRKLCDHLLLMQYPVRSAERTYDKAHVVATRVKPKQQSVELEVALDTKSSHYSVTGAKDTGCMDRQVCKHYTVMTDE